jgi:Poly(ADP-ribose) polymerase catalytic domain
MTNNASTSQLPWQQLLPPQPTVKKGTAASVVKKARIDPAAGCCVSHGLPYISHDVTDKASRSAHQCNLIWKTFQTYLQTPDFVDFCRVEGILDPSIVLCEQSSNNLWDAFCTQLEKDYSASYSPSNIQLGIIFHGTCKDNVASILKSGLDPKKRSGQAYGVGEYFSKNPSTSLGYCKGGNQMLVFCVVIPASSTHAHKPDDFVVVSQAQHQVPMAVLEFSGASAGAVQRSQQIRTQLQSLNRLVHDADKATKEAENKAKIIQLLIANELQAAAHKYCAAYTTFSHVTKLEISYWAHLHADAEFVKFYFNGQAGDDEKDSDELYVDDTLLPPPPDWNTFQKDIVSVEAQQAKLDKAWADVKECQEKLKTEVDKNSSSNNNNTSNKPVAASLGISPVVAQAAIAAAVKQNYLAPPYAKGTPTENTAAAYAYAAGGSASKSTTTPAVGVKQEGDDDYSVATTCSNHPPRRKWW